MSDRYGGFIDGLNPVDQFPLAVVADDSQQDISAYFAGGWIVGGQRYVYRPRKKRKPAEITKAKVAIPEHVLVDSNEVAVAADMSFEFFDMADAIARLEAEAAEKALRIAVRRRREREVIEV